MIWFGFLLSIALLMVAARKSVWLGLTLAAIVLGLFTLPLSQLCFEILNTLSDVSVLLLALAVGLIPLIGGALEISGLMDDLTENLRMKKKTFLAFSPALLGLLPMPGGALLSAPMVKKVGKDIPAGNKSALNIWFRHVFILIYPLGALLVTTKIAGLDLYLAILYLIPGFILMLGLGYIFLLKGIKNDYTFKKRFDPKKLIAPFSIILTAPLIHLTLMTIFSQVTPEIPLLIGVSTSLLLALHIGKFRLAGIKEIAVKMRIWDFALIIIGMFLFLNIFKASNAPKVVATLPVSKAVFLVGIGALFGFITGRVQAPVAIILPVYFTKFGTGTISPLAFAITYFSIFMGYVISPVHPCVSVSIEYFKVKFSDLLKILAAPTAIALAITFILAVIFL